MKSNGLVKNKSPLQKFENHGDIGWMLERLSAVCAYMSSVSPTDKQRLIVAIHEAGETLRRALEQCTITE